MCLLLSFILMLYSIPQQVKIFNIELRLHPDIFLHKKTHPESIAFGVRINSYVIRIKAR